MMLESFKASSKRKRFTEILAVAVIGSAIVFMLIVLFSLWQEARIWDPLGDYPVQPVTSENNINLVEISALNPKYAEIGTPAIYLNQTIKSTGIKCVKDGEGVVGIKGVLYWQSDRPPGKILEISKGVSRRGPGCVSYEFENEIPTKVREEIERLKAQGIHESTWRITGVEVPVKENGDEGAERTWETTSFVIIHKNAPIVDKEN